MHRDIHPKIKTPFHSYRSNIPAGTSIVTESENIPIEHIKVDDKVLSFNHQTNRPEMKKVTSIQSYLVSVIMALVFHTGDTLLATPNHPFWYKDQYVEAEALDTGGVLTALGGATEVIANTFVKDTTLRVYNYTVVAMTASVSARAQSEFRVKAGETFIVTKKDQNMVVDKWIMEDNSTIILSEEVSKWKIKAGEASFDKNCRILGVGRNGRSGANSTAIGQNGVDCKDGQDGGAGEDGMNGSKGKSVKIKMRLLYVDGLMIDVRGGDGGDGGNGADGDDGGKAACETGCNGGKGGNGGVGGKGGQGGKGGKVEIDYRMLKNIKWPGNNKGIVSITSGGQAGLGGSGGKGGKGGDGVKCNGYDSKNGSPGKNGGNGRDGKKGKDSCVNINFLGFSER